MPSMKGYHALKNLPEEKVTDKISRRVLAGDQEMVVWWSMKAGAHAAAHQHPHEQIFWMISGKMEFRLGTDRRVCGPGDLALLLIGAAGVPLDGDVRHGASPGLVGTAKVSHAPRERVNAA